MSSSKFLTMVLSLVFVSVCFAQSSPAEKYVQAFSEKKNAWLVKKNYDSLQNLLDKRCLYMHSNGWVQTATEVVDDLKSGKLNYTKVTVLESQARQYEKMVIVTGKGKFEGLMESGTAFTVELLYTEVYVNRKDGWKLVTRQATKATP